jgi:hypothetical protein
MPTDPFRVRRDGLTAQTDTRLWILLHDGQTTLLPPLTTEGQDALRTALQTTVPEILTDHSGNEIARLYPLPMPDLFSHLAPLSPVDATFNDEIQLADYELASTDLTPGQVFFVTLFWKALQPPREDYEIFVQLWNDQGQAVSSWQNVPYSGMYRTRIWRTDELVPTHHWLTLPEDAPPGRYRLVVGLYRTLQQTRLDASGQNANPEQDVAVVADLRSPLLPLEDAGTMPPWSTSFGDVLRIAGLDVSVDGTPQPLDAPLNAAPGQTVTLDVTWQAVQHPPLDYSVFVHLTSDDNHPPAAQLDRTIGDAYPTGIWQPGERVHDTYALTIPNDLPPGTYDLWLGVYYWATGERLSATRDGAPQPDNRLLLGRVVIP